MEWLSQLLDEVGANPWMPTVVGLLAVAAIMFATTIVL